MGDWDCDGVDTPGLYRQTDGFVYLRNTNTQGIADVSFLFGDAADVPVAGDFNADGCDTVSIYRPSEQLFYIINKLGENNGGLGAADYSFQFGNLGDIPFVGDFNGNGQDTVGLHRESTGLVYFRNTNTTGIADHQFMFGDPGDRFMAGDWTGDGVDSPGLFRPADTTMYLRYTNGQGIADESAQVGEPEWLPVAGRMHISCAGQSSVPAIECEALIALYESTNGSGWASREGWMVDLNPCNWHGVVCTGGTVTELGALDTTSETSSFTYNDMVGVLPPELGNLTNLTSLNLPHNWIVGPIPPELGNLTHLTRLDLSYNWIVGPIPPEMANLANLAYLNLSWNRLSGPIPPELGKLTNLTQMRLYSNQLSGPIPPDLGDLHGLLLLFLFDNDLSGEVPPELRNLFWLDSLQLHGQTGCLTATDPTLAQWLSTFDPEWNDSCP
jgi:hypothetical protein